MGLNQAESTQHLTLPADLCPLPCWLALPTSRMALTGQLVTLMTVLVCHHRYKRRFPRSTSARLYSQARTAEAPRAHQTP